MQTYDFVMLFVLGGLTIYGYSKGMAWQLAYLTSFIASYFVAAKFSGQLAPLFGDAAPWNKFVAMLAIYAGTSLAIWMIFRMVRRGIDKIKLQSFDRQMGAIVGAARGVLWCVGITFVLVTVLPNSFDRVKQHVVGSRSGYYIAKLLDEADAVVPPEVHQVIGPHLDRLEQQLNQGQQPGLSPGFQGIQGFGNPGFQGQGFQGQGFQGQGFQGQAAPGQGFSGGNPNPWQQPTGNNGGGFSTSPQAGSWPGNQWPAQPAGGTPAQPASWPNGNTNPAANNSWPPR